MGIFTNVAWTRTGKRYFLERHMVAVSKILAFTNLLWQSTGHSFLYICILLSLTNVFRHTFECFCRDAILAAIAKQLKETATVLLSVLIVVHEKLKNTRIYSRTKWLHSFKELVFWSKIYLYLLAT